MTAPYRFTVRYDEALMRDAVRVFMMQYLRRHRRSFLTYGLFLLILGVLAWSGQKYGLLGLVAGVVGSWLFGFAYVWRRSLKRIESRLLTSRPELDFVFQDGDLSVSSDQMSLTMPWSTIDDVWMLPRYWLIVIERRYFVLPLDRVSEEALNFVRGKFES